MHSSKQGFCIPDSFLALFAWLSLRFFFGAKEGIACSCLMWYVLLDLHMLQFSMCKALKRVLFKQRHRKVVVEPNFWYHDEIPLTEFQFVKVSSIFLSLLLHRLSYLPTYIPSFLPSLSHNRFLSPAINFI